MPSYPCSQLKTEYERLKTLKEAFVLEYAKIDETSDLVKVRKLSKELERLIKEFKDKLCVSIESARKILGENVYESEEIENALGFKVPESEIPKIPYSSEVLKQAEKLGERLILRISHDKDGVPLTMERIEELGQARMRESDGLLLWGDWYREQDFYEKDSLKTEWKLVGGSFVENSTSQNYIEQTRILRNYLKSIDSLSIEEETECSGERLDEIDKIMQKDWSEAAKLLVSLKINQNHRRSPAEIIYDWLLEFKKTRNRGFLNSLYDWSNVCSADGSLVDVGGVDASGANIGVWRPSNLSRSQGVVSVR